jgi:NADH dehydrogenase [ubiquinone] 1 alpha subcomplex assembly factor 1
MLAGTPLTMSTHPRDQIILFEPQSVPAGHWQVVNDDVMGGASTSSLQLNEAGAVFQGELSRANSGGFASVRLVLAPFDLAGMDMILVRLRGDGRRYKFTLRMEPHPNSPIYQCGLPTKPGEWEEHCLPSQQFTATFRGRAQPNALPLDLAKVVAAGFLISDLQEGRFRLEIARIAALARC